MDMAWPWLGDCQMILYRAAATIGISKSMIQSIGMSSGTRIFEYINWHPTIRTSGGKKIPYHSFFGDIEFRNVSFTYPTRPEQVVIDNLSLKIKGGQMVSFFN